MPQNQGITTARQNDDKFEIWTTSFLLTQETNELGNKQLIHLD